MTMMIGPGGLISKQNMPVAADRPWQGKTVSAIIAPSPCGAPMPAANAASLLMLQKMRCRGIGIPFITIGKSVRHASEDVPSSMERHRANVDPHCESMGKLMERRLGGAKPFLPTMGSLWNADDSNAHEWTRCVGECCNGSHFFFDGKGRENGWKKKSTYGNFS
ncbi:MAG: hypothetical protein J6P53_05960 [Mailhella sp.]|nr:hypothetical protein [Mailhella sp.]